MFFTVERLLKTPPPTPEGNQSCSSPANENVMSDRNISPGTIKCQDAANPSSSQSDESSSTSVSNISPVVAPPPSPESSQSRESPDGAPKIDDDALAAQHTVPSPTSETKEFQASPVGDQPSSNPGTETDTSVEDRSAVGGDQEAPPTCQEQVLTEPPPLSEQEREIAPNTAQEDVTPPTTPPEEQEPLSSCSQEGVLPDSPSCEPGEDVQDPPTCVHDENASTASAGESHDAKDSDSQLGDIS